MIKKFLNNKLYANSLIFFIASLLGAFGNYAFHFLMARLLSPSSYGELQSLISLSVIFGIPVGVLSVVITKYTAEFKAKNENHQISWLFKIFTKKLFFLGLIFFLLLLLATPFISNFLALKSLSSLIILIGSFIFVFLAALNNSVLQGLEKFKALSAISIITVILKIFLAFILIKLSLAVSGAVLAFVLAGLIAYGLTFIPLRFLIKSMPLSSLESAQPPIKQMLNFSVPVLLIILFTTLLYNLDILLVKHFFDSAVAGQYAALALLGHIIFFLIGPLIAVMFPAAAAAHASSISTNLIFKKSFLMSFFVGVITLAFYFTFPALIIKIIVGANYLELAPYLGWFGTAMFLFSLISLLSQYFLSISKTRFTYILFIAVFCQTALISIWHASLWQIVWIMNGVMAVCLAGLAVYYTKTLNRYDFCHHSNPKSH